MVGYMHDKIRVLREWYQLFQQKHHYIISDSACKHWNRVVTCGFPNFKNDSWKYAVFEEFLKHHFIFHEDTKLNIIDEYERLKLSIDSYVVVFINGRFSLELSDTSIDPWILKFDNSSDRYDINPIFPDMFLYLTECLSNSMVRIRLPKKTITKKPLYLLYITEGSYTIDKLVTSHYYSQLEIEQDTESCVIEHFISANNGSYFNGSRTIISVGSRSKLDHVKLVFENEKSYHIAHQDIHSQKSTVINSNLFIIGPKFTFHKINSSIDHDQVLLSLNSLVFLLHQNTGDIHTYLKHNNKDYSISKQLHKIIAGDRSIGMFTGLIKVNKNAINTDAKMINNNLLLSQYASIYSVPKLEIYSDAVQCSHGATIGQINLDHLFYLSTRGLSKTNALKILIYSFTIEIIKQIKSSSLKDCIIEKFNNNLIRII